MESQRKVDPNEQRGLFLLGFEPESGVYELKYGFAPYFHTEVQRLYGNTAYIRRIIPIDF